MSFKAREVRRNLKRKGFVESANKHHIYLHFHFEGKVTPHYTYTSHGKDADEIGPKIVRSMVDQLGLSKIPQVRALVECTMSETEYIETLRANGKLP